MLNKCGIAQALALRLQVIVGPALVLCHRTSGVLLKS